MIIEFVQICYPLFIIQIDQTEPMEMDVGDTVTSSGPVEVKTAAVAADSERKSARGSNIPVQLEILAAEEFERTSDCNVEFELHID